MPLFYTARSPPRARRLPPGWAAPMKRSRPSSLHAGRGSSTGREGHLDAPSAFLKSAKDVASYATTASPTNGLLARSYAKVDGWP